MSPSSDDEKRRRALARTFRGFSAPVWSHTDWEELMNLADRQGVTVVVLRTTAEGTLAYVREPFARVIQSRCFPSLNTQVLEGFFVGSRKDGNSGPTWLVGHPRKPREAVNPRSDYLSQLPALEAALAAALDPVDGVVGRFGCALWEWLDDILLPQRGTVPRVALVLEGPGLAALPLHAVWRPEPSRPKRRVWLDDYYLINRYPNVRFLRDVLQREERTPVRVTCEKLISLRNPFDDLGTSRVLVDLAGRCFGRHQYTEDLKTLLRYLPSYEVALLAAHGVFDLLSPRLSGLVVDRDNPVGNPTLRTAHLAMLNLARVQLIAFCGCETGQTEFWESDWSAPSLVDAALMAGERSAFASHWRVDQLPCAMLMSHVFEVLRTGEGDVSPAQSFRRTSLAPTANGHSVGLLARPARSRILKQSRSRRIPRATRRGGCTRPTTAVRQPASLGRLRLLRGVLTTPAERAATPSVLLVREG